MTAVETSTDTTEETPERRGRLRPRLRPSDLPIAVPAVLWLGFAWHRRWITDDGLIAARTVRQILAGNGPVFNHGERVEANTSALWTWMTAAVAWVTRLDVYTVFLVCGLVLSTAGLVLAQMGTRRMLRSAGRGGLVVPLGAVAVAVLPPFWDFATSGLEECLVFGWLGLCWWLLSGWREGRSAGRAVVLGLGWVVRPDMLLASLGFLAVLLAVTWTGWRRALGLLASAAAIPAVYEVFRMGYYGIVVPNTALTKEASASDLGQGLTYLGDYVNPYVLWLPALFIAVFVAAARPWRGMRRKDLLVWVSAFAVGLVLAAYVIYIGGDFMHARMLLPGTFALLLPVMCVPVPDGANVRAVASYAALAGTAVWAVVCVADLRHAKATPAIPASGIIDERGYWVMRTKDANPVDAAPYIHMVTDSTDATVGLRDKIKDVVLPDGTPALYFADGTGKLVGVPLTTPYGTIALPGELLGTLGAMVPLSGVAIDDHGLSYAVGSHLEMNGTRPGHRKSTSITWVLADYTAVQNGQIAGGGAVDAARKDLGCGDLAELQTATRAPLTFGRFWSNFVHAYPMSTFRVPNDPQLAEDVVCP
jgi:arabinofuranosyltransferase